MNYKFKIKDIITRELPFALSVPAVIWQILFLYIPLFIIIYTSFHVSGTLWHQYTFSYYATFFNSIYFRIIFRSLVIAVLVSVACLLSAYPIAYFLALK